ILSVSITNLSNEIA
ncbi:hypothetical protein D043_4833B, partial [Vibrio parahaemolyticus EKP-021]